MNRRDEIIAKVLRNVKVDPETGCWIWQGGTSGNGRGGGYGRVWVQGQACAVHIVTYTHYHGYIPGKLHVDHVCRNRLCCNPAHLEAVTASENQRRRVHAKLKLELESQS